MIRSLIDRLTRRLRQASCVFLNGQHDLMRAYDETRLFQRCVCGYETPGITIDRRDRRIRLAVSNPEPRRVMRPAAGYARARAQAGR